MTSKDSPSTTSSPASVDGPMPSDSPAGLTIDLFGPDRAPVSHGHRPGRGSGRRIPTTSGPIGDGSLTSTDLQRYLESRLYHLLPVNGSPEYVLTWKRWDMPSGPPICALRASGRRKSGKGFGGWATPAQRDFKSEQATDEFNLKRYAHNRGKPLSAQVLLAGYPTPRATRMGQGSPDRAHEHNSRLEDMILLAGYPTPGTAVINPKKNIKVSGRTPKDPQVGLADVVALAGYSTPSAGDDKRGAPLRRHSRQRNSLIRDISQVQGTTPGTTSTFLNLRMEKRGGLNPAHSRWLMGYPPEFCACAVTAIRSIPKRQQSS